jgi:hypothetical protein
MMNMRMSSYEIRRFLKGQICAPHGSDWRLPRYAMNERLLREDKRQSQGPACPLAGQPK